MDARLPDSNEGIMQPTWVGSPTDVRFDAAALAALSETNDSRFARGNEVLMVDASRWRAAQEFERRTWMEIAPHAQSDRNEEHAIHFDSYRSLPRHLGRTVEIGCGPFTQIRTIIDLGHEYTSVDLVDPLLSEYEKHPNCGYASLHGERFSIPAEQFAPTALYDVVVCINVLEHVYNAELALGRMAAALKPHGHLVFHERSWDVDPKLLYDVGHPVRISEKTLFQFFANFQMVHYKKVLIAPECTSHYAVLKR
jgi:2-polyprenyl-3-methyl-5-hydroxy-6-metoxy-1,4-benzoquinol methylase